ncbi:ATP synthase F1 subunit epsilon [Candidatus Peregrinibacteria bacterium]|nr:ATP synthase F1 subunit epsilon [Candidatus Peregrinibacteria bacterium]
MKQIQFKIVTPEKVLYEGMVEGVSFPTPDGEITVLPHHIPLISAVKPGELKIKKDGKEEFFSVTSGVVEVDGTTITLLTDAAEHATAVDEKRAEEAVKRAQAIMSEQRHDEEGYAEAVAQMERALSRIKIAKKHRHGGSKPTFNDE